MRKAVGSIALALFLAAAGCTTNNNPGNGQPTNTPSTTPSSTPGASSGSTSTQGPMASAITTPKTNSERAAATVDAIAVLAADQGYRGRVLGAANPAPQGAAVVSTTAAAPATVSTVDNSMQASPASTNIRLETDSSGNVIMTNVSAASAPVVSTTTTGATSTTTTTASTSRMRRLLNYLKGKK